MQSLMCKTEFTNCGFSPQILFPFTSDRFFCASQMSIFCLGYTTWLYCGYTVTATPTRWSFAITLSPLFVSQVIENIDALANLDSLFLGKNKITKLQNLDALTNLTVLSIQVLAVF